VGRSELGKTTIAHYMAVKISEGFGDQARLPLIGKLAELDAKDGSLWRLVRSYANEVSGGSTTKAFVEDNPIFAIIDDVEGTSPPDDIDALYDSLEVPNTATPPRLAIAVAQILLHHVQGSLPQWASVTTDKVSLNRKEHNRHKDARLAFNPQLICTINWADSGPGFSWPESYHVTYLPGFDKFVITASRDGPDAWGCSDHAIGVADGSLSPVEAAKEVIVGFWATLVSDWEHSRWAYLFSEGLIDKQTANEWADEVWCDSEQ
jgi:hypothetical protein